MVCSNWVFLSVQSGLWRGKPLPVLVSDCQQTVTMATLTVMPHLNETNYLTWHVHMHTLLIHNDLWEIVLGKESPPDPSKASPTKINTYVTRQLKAAAKITLYVDDSQIIRVQGDDPQVIWNALASVHHACGLSTQLAAM